MKQLYIRTGRKFEKFNPVQIGDDYYENGELVGKVIYLYNDHYSVILLNKEKEGLIHSEADAWAQENGGRLPTVSEAFCMIPNKPLKDWLINHTIFTKDKLNPKSKFGIRLGESISKSTYGMVPPYYNVATHAFIIKDIFYDK